MTGIELLPVRSFDIFDTLVTRKCVEPILIFKEIENRVGFHNFAEIRSSVEADLWIKGEYDFGDIYENIDRRLSLGKRYVEFLKEIELEVEYTNLFAIADNVDKVEPGDILINDMYLPKSFITRIVREKCKLFLNPIYLSCKGKSSGIAWQLLQKRVAIESHLGDNPHSDGHTAKLAGISSSITKVSKFTDVELLLCEMDYRELALFIREKRLKYCRSKLRDFEIISA